MTANCTHEWILNLGKNMNFVFCSRCAEQFKPEPQQLPYRGTVPERFKK